MSPRKRHIAFNPDEPSSGDFAFEFQKAVHPVLGRESDIDRMDEALAPFYGERVRVRILFGRINPETGENVGRRLYATRTFDLNEYSDMFGPGSAYANATHAVKEAYSPDELIAYSFEIEEV